jgi:ATP-dependent Clp protease ATP-binding subunit ClpA
MFERFVRDAHYAALEAMSVAAGLGSSSVEAEHLLISLASGKSQAAYALREVGLEPQEIRDAVQRDFERALLAVGVDAGGVHIPANCRRTKPRWGASARQGLERARAEAKRRGDRKIGCEHLLRGLLAAEHGTVPRILAAEGISRDELTGRL